MTLAGFAKFVAVLLVVGVLGVVVWGVMQQPQQRVVEQAPPSGMEDPFSEPLVAEGGGGEGGAGAADGDVAQALIGDLGQTQYTAVDPETGLVRFQIEWTALDLLGDGLYSVQDPVGRFYEPDRTLVVQADSAEIVWPTRDEIPESGQMMGRVAVRVYDSADRPTPERPMPAKLPTPAAVLESDSLNFQAALGQIDTRSAVRAVMPGLSFEGIGLTLRVSETRGRLQFLRVDEHLTTTVRPDEMRRGSSLFAQPAVMAGGEAAGGEGAGAAAADSAGEGDGAERVDLYKLEFGGAFEVAQGARRVAAGRASVWTRLRDQRLAEGAISSLDGLLPGGGAQGGGAGVESGVERRTVGEERADPIVMTGRTSIVITPLEDDPQERLASDDLAVTFESTNAADVMVADSSQRFSLTAQRLSYWAGQRRLEARPRGDTLGVEWSIERPDGTRFELAARNLFADLTRGQVEMPGRGRVVVVRDDADGSGFDEASVVWERRLEARFLGYDEAAQLGTGTGLTGLFVEGGVRASSREIETSSDSLRVAFDTHVGDGVTRSMLRAVKLDTGRSDRASLILKDSGGSVDEGAIAAKTVEVAFEPSLRTDPLSRPMPVQATATEAVTASTEAGSLRAETLVSTFALDAGGDVIVNDLTAQVRVEVKTVEGVVLTGHRVRYREGVSELIAEGNREAVASLGYFADADGGAVDGVEDPALAIAASASGPEIRLNRDRRTMVVYGAGKAALAERDPSTLGFTTVSAEFDREMLFDDLSGRFVLDGGARVSSFATDGSRTDLAGSSIEVELIQDLLVAERRQEIEEEPAAAVRRVLLRGDGDVDALARLRRYDPVTGKLVTAAELVGGSINADARFRRVFVPTAGRLRLLDLSEDPDAPVADAEAELDPNEEVELGFSGKGAATFAWEGSFDLDGRTDIITLTNGTSVRYRAPRAAEPTQVECQSLAIYLERPEMPLASASAEELLGPVLIEQINAVGAVFAQHQGRQIIADSLIYQRALNSVTANAARRNRVTITEPGSAAVVNARSITLDLETNEFEGVGIETVTVPQ